VGAYEALEAWVVVRHTGPARPSLTRFIEEHRGPTLDREMNALRQAVLMKDGSWQGAGLAQAIERIRKKIADERASRKG
jgi:hypothetical protein